MQAFKVLIVEDEALVAEELRLNLSRLGGVRAVTALSGEAAVERAAAETPDLVLMDIMLDGKMDGIEAAEAIRSKNKVPVIYLTAYEDAKILERAKATHPWGYLLKPFNLRELHINIDMALQRVAAERRQRDAEVQFLSVSHSLMDALIISNSQAQIVYFNPAAETIFGFTEKEILGQPESRLIPPALVNRHEQSRRQMMPPAGAHSPSRRFETSARRKDGKEFPAEVSISRWEAGSGNFFSIAVRDISERKQAEDKSKAHQAELEQHVQERTAELRAEIEERKKTETALQSKTHHLQEANAALNILMQKRDEDKRELQEKVLLNIKQLVLPYLEKLKSSPLGRQQKNCVDSVEKNLREVISPFSYRLSSRYLNLTPSEIRVASFIKDGQSTKQIAGQMGLSKRTIDAYRENIRKKLGLTNQNVNLCTHLLNFVDT